MYNTPKDEEGKDLWRKMDGRDLELHALEELAQFLDEAKVDEQEGRKGQTRVIRQPQQGQIDTLFRHVMVRLGQESKRGANELSKRLVALERLEKGLAGFLVARIDAVDYRIHQLQLERVRLERLIDSSSKSILSMLFTGVKSQFKLKNVKAELHALHEEKQRIGQKKAALNHVRAVILGKSKEKAQTVLDQAREEGLIRLQDLLMDRMERCPNPSKLLTLSSFVKRLTPRERAFVGKASDANSYAHGIQGLLEELEILLKESAEALPNRCLFLAKLLAHKRSQSLLSVDQCLALYRLVDTGMRTPSAVKTVVEQLSPESRKRIEQFVRLIRRFVKDGSAHLFRDLLIRYEDIQQLLPATERPALNDRRRHRDCMNDALDEVMQVLVEHCQT